ncbi:MAG TPA: penicillin-insensitive murein endopeptidase [Gaiellaceae bacterium]|nr:penicillin-insensitive murein endopeptidase [Gaiellaceae bacterium]
MSRLPAFFAALTLGGGAVVVAVTLLRAPAPAIASGGALVASPLPQLAPHAVPAADRIRTPIPRLEPKVDPVLAAREALESAIAWRPSRPLGSPNAGTLGDGVVLPREGVHFFTWDPFRWRTPSPASRRHGTDRLVRTVLGVVRAYARANPDAPRVGIGDLSRPEGGPFDARFGVVGEFGPARGYLGHVSHQNGLDVDVYYPRVDGAERAPDRLEDVDRVLAQQLVDLFVAAGAEFVFVGPRTGLTGPPGVVQPLARHDDHLHVRLPPG